MGSHPLNLALRFLLEMSVLYAVCYWVWKTQEGYLKYVLIILLPVLMAFVWGVFAVPNDPSRSGQTVIAVSGWIRLLIEASFFAIGAWAFSKAYTDRVGLSFFIIVLVHYALSYDRISWLLRNEKLIT